MKQKILKIVKIVLIIIGVLCIVGCMLAALTVVGIRLYNRDQQRNVEMIRLFNKAWSVSWAEYDEEIFTSNDLMGNEALFSLLEESYTFPESIQGLSVTSFDDPAYYQLAEAYLREIKGAEYDQWVFRESQYTLYNCQLGFNGPVTPIYQFIKIDPDLTKSYIPLYEIGVVPWDHVIGSYDHSDDFYWGNTDWEISRHQFLAVDAAKAYKIAQENGGFAAVNNRQSESCRVYVRFRYGGFNYWIIRYEDAAGSFFTIRVDPDTGDWSILQE